MYQRTAAAVTFVGVIGFGTAFSQTPAQAPNPTQRQVDTAPEVNPVFRITVIGRSTTAINYRPRNGETKVDFAGTPLLPGARGDATVKGERGYIRVDANFENLEPATKFGPEYLTYVLWAITPEGRATNLGELQVSGDDGELDVTTELQAFGLLVTAEPYFAVTQPSDVVVMENMFRKEGVFKDATIGSTDVVEANYQLLKRGTYLMNQSPANYKPQEIKPGVPLDLAEARNAINLARLAGADRYAADTFDKASGLLAQAEKATGKNNIMMPARQAVQTAEDARLIALQRQEEELNARLRAQAEAERLAAEQRQKDALARASAEEARRRQAESDAQSAAAARAAADRDRAAAEAARASAEAQAAQARASAEQAEREKEALREKLRQQLNVILETRETARGLIVNVSDVLFDFNSANLKPGAREKLARVAGILQAYPGLEIAIEGHTDSVGSDQYNQGLSERRAVSVRSYLTQSGIPESTVTALGFGESQPVATNASSTGRQQNRRVELVVSGDPITVTTSTTSTTVGTVGTSGRR